MVLLIGINFLTPMNNGFLFDQSKNQSNSINTVTGSIKIDSFDARPFFSNSGRLHLLFQHEFHDYDAISINYYHTYELENGSWAQPVKMFEDIRESYPIFAIHPSDRGFAIYYKSNGLSLKEYDEKTNTWLDPLVIFGANQIHQYLDISLSKVSWYIHSFLLLDNGGFLVAWNFCFQDNSHSTHEDEQSYIVSRVDPNGSVFSHPIRGWKSCSSRDSLTLVNYDDSIFLYDQDYWHRAVLFSNRSWSEWSELNTDYTFHGHRILVANQFLVCDATKKPRESDERIWVMLDLANENLTVKALNIPYNPNISSFYYVDVEQNMSLTSRPIFITAMVINGTIELWEYNYFYNTWNQVAFHNYGIIPWTFGLYAGSSKFELIQDETLWRIFWDQKIVNSTNEIYTAFYNSSSKEWSPITQVTDTNTITDDYSKRISGFSFFNFLLMSSVIFIYLRKIKKRPLSKSISFML